MPNALATERATVARAKTGDREAIGQLWDAYGSRVYGYLRHTLGDPSAADDCFQQTWMRAIEALPDFEWRGASFGAWLFAIARNEVRQRWRKVSREVPLDLEIHDPPDPRDPIHTRSVTDLVERALTQLSDDDRELLRLRYIGDLAVGDVARTLGISTGAAYVRLHRALRRARTALDVSL